jgi:hypothetical protein
MLLNSYIESTRKIKGQRNEKLNDYYHKVFNIIKKHAQFDISGVELEVIYSSNKTAELLYLKDRHFLVYDQYLGQVFNMMNRLFFNATEPRESLAYSFKIFAEEIQLEGRPDIGLIFALSYLKVIEESSTYKKDIDLATRLNYTAIQEMFVMVHELIHFSKIADAKYIEQSRSEVLTMMEDLLARLDDKELQDDTTFSYLADEYKLLYSDQQFSKDLLPEGYFEKVRDQHIQNEKDSHNRIIEMIKTSNALIEEIICDEQAAVLTMYIMTREYQFHPETSFDGIYLAMLHLRTLGILNAEAKYFNATEDVDKADLSQFLLTSDLRTRKLRNELTKLNGHLSDNPNNSEAMHNAFRATNEHYHSIILDPVLFMTLPKIADMKAERATADLDYDQLIKDSENVDLAFSLNTPPEII